MSRGAAALKRPEHSETLVRIKRWPSLLKRFKYVRIFSGEHGSYWNGTGQGYTGIAADSHIWTAEDAFKRTRHCGPEKMIRFIEVPSAQVVAALLLARHEAERCNVERRLLLYLETCAVDTSGIVDMVRVNAEELALIQNWAAEGFLSTGTVSGYPRDQVIWVRLSPEAMDLAHEFRRRRAELKWEKKTYKAMGAPR